MGWTTPRTYTTGEIITKTILDAHVRDNLKYLKGESGVPTIESGLIIDNAGGDEYLQIPSLTTVERDALTPVNGMVIYNETTTEFNKYEAGAWVDLADNTDHGGLDGLADDDHTQYPLKTILTTEGDILYRNATVWTRLPKGAAGYILSQNSGLTAPEWRAESAITNILKSHTRDLTAASGDIAYTGYGFQPTSLIIFASSSAVASWGFGDVNLSEMNVRVLYDGTYSTHTTTIITFSMSVDDVQYAVLKTLDADGFTLTWTKAGTPTGTKTFIVLALR